MRLLSFTVSVATFGLLLAIPADSAQSPQVACVASSGTAYKVRPKTCEFVPPSRTSGFYVERLKWSSWGRKSATGKGTWRGNMDASGSAKVVLSAPERCGEGSRPWYSRISISIDGRKPTKGKLLGPCT